MYVYFLIIKAMDIYNENVKKTTIFKELLTFQQAIHYNSEVSFNQK
jgi:hypothetical protein